LVKCTLQANYSVLQHTYPIYIIGAGGIVHDAHLPAYRIAGFQVAGIYDLNQEKAMALAKQFAVPTVFETLESLIEAAPGNAIFDLALPGAAIPDVLQKLPNNAYALIQKPMGDVVDMLSDEARSSPSTYFVRVVKRQSIAFMLAIK